MEIREMTALTLGRAIKSREVGVREAVKASLDRSGKNGRHAPCLSGNRWKKRYTTG